jgi:hypothetical protein
MMTRTGPPCRARHRLAHTPAWAVNVPCRRNLSPRIRTYPRRITIADPVPGIAQPRLADTSAFLTWRQPPSR